MLIKRGPIAMIAVAGLLFAAGCGGDDDDNSDSSASGGSVSQFEQAAEEAGAEVTEFPGPGSGPTPVPKGRSVFIVTCSSQGVGCVEAAKGATEAAESLGWSAQTIDGRGTPDGWNSALRTAISSGADGIIIAAVPPALIGDGLQRAQQAEVPVVSVFNPPSKQSSGVAAYVRPVHTEQGAAMADFVAADSGGEAKVILVREDAFPEIKERQDGFEERLSQCDGCEIVTTVQSQLASLANRMPGTITSALQQNPDATYIVNPYDAAGVFVAQGIQAAGKSGQVKIVGYEGDPSAIDSIRNGEAQVATIANPHGFMGYQAINEMVRAFAGESPANITTPDRLITEESAQSIPQGDGWEPEFDYRKDFESLWTTGKS